MFNNSLLKFTNKDLPLSITLLGRPMRSVLDTKLIIIIVFSFHCICTIGFDDLFVKKRLLVENIDDSTDRVSPRSLTQDGTNDSDTVDDSSDQSVCRPLWVCRWSGSYSIAACSQETNSTACVCYSNSTCTEVTVNRCASCLDSSVISVNMGQECSSNSLMGKYVRCQSGAPELDPPCDSGATRGCQCFNNGTCKPAWVNPCKDCQSLAVALVVQNGVCPPCGVVPRIY